jgi:hypothetical protein
MMLPILISVSEAPVSYFFCAIAPVTVEANTMSVAATARPKFRLESTSFSLACSAFP